MPVQRKIAAMLAATVLLMTAVGGMGCADVQNQPKTAGGALIGGAAGGLAGSQFGGGKGNLAMTGLGALLGALMGSEVGKSLDRADQMAAAQATQQSLETAPTGHVSEWRNPDNGHYGSVRPLSTTQRPDGQVCREFQQTIVVGGQTQQGVGTACRQPDGSWKIVQGA
jgi:surface antigen